MGWRLHLSNQPVVAVQIIPGDPPQIAVWNNQRDVHFYDQEDATPSGKREFAQQHPPADVSDDVWREFVSELRGPNGSFLPTVNIGGLAIHTSRDGRMRLYHFQDGHLKLELDGQYVALDREEDGRFLAASLDRALGLIGAVNESGTLYVFQQHVRVGTFPLNLTPDIGARLSVLIPDAGGKLIVGNGERVMVTDSAGRIQHEIQPHYATGVMAASPDGEIIALADIDDNVIRIYNNELRPTRQKYAIDLMMGARQVQLIASMPGRRVALSALDVSDDGVLAFAMGGVVCVSELAALDVLPQPRPLF